MDWIDILFLVVIVSIQLFLFYSFFIRNEYVLRYRIRTLKKYGIDGYNKLPGYYTMVFQLFKWRW